MDRDGGSFYCRQVTQELKYSLWLVGTIECQIDPSAKTSSNNSLSIIPTTPLLIQSEIEREQTSGTVSTELEPPPSLPIIPRRRGPPTPTKVTFLDPASNVITELESLTPPISIPPSPHLGRIDLPPIFSGHSTPTSPEPIEPLVLQSAPQEIRIHRVLYQASDLQFDAAMTLQPRLVSQDTPTGRSSPLFEYDTATLAEAATSPPLPSMLLVCDNLPWKIRVSPSPPNLFVTIYDVLQTIHVNLRTPVVTAEWPLYGTLHDREAILQTFERRIKRLPNESAQNEERAKSVRRVDCLMGSIRLVRITSSEDPEVFVMEWGLPQ